MIGFRVPLKALALSLAVGAAPAALAAPIVLEAPNGLSTLAITGAPGGGFAIVAQELVPYAGGTDPRIHVYRYEDNGKQRWSRVIDRVGPQIAKAITYGPGEILYIAGLDGSELTAMGYQSMLVGIGPRGDIDTDQVFGDPAPVEDFLSGVALAGGGDLIAAGRNKATPEGTADLEVMRVTTDGTVLWSDKLKNAAKESYPVVSSSRDGVYVAGSFENRTVYVKRVNEAGQTIEDFASFTAPRRCAVAQMTVLPDGGVVLGINLSGGKNQARIVRIGANGKIVWDKAIDGEATIADLTLLRSGVVVIAGTSDDPDTLATGAWLRAFDESGSQIGEILPETQGETRAGGVTLDQDGGVYFAYSPIDESIPAQPVPVIVERIRVE
ncbi:MAG: hypothetical protein QM698_02815 [Micropepsaceae bacterium]